MAADGFGERMGAGSRPALVVVDLVNGFTDPESPLWCDADAAVAATARLLDAARASARRSPSRRSSTTRPARGSRGRGPAGGSGVAAARLGVASRPCPAT